MAVKTITVTREAYEALKGLKEIRESFSETILRVAKRRPLTDFLGILSKESGDRLERVIKEQRKQRQAAHEARMKRIREAFEGS